LQDHPSQVLKKRRYYTQSNAPLDSRVFSKKRPSFDVDRYKTAIVKMGLFPRRWNRRSTRDELQKDVEELVETVLPLCQFRPSVYNEVSKHLREWITEIAELDTLLVMKQSSHRRSKQHEYSVDRNNGLGRFFGEDEFCENVSNCDSLTINEELSSNPDYEWSLHSPDLWSLPDVSETPNSIEELRQDYELLTSPRFKAACKRANIRQKVRMLVDQLQSDMAVYKKIRREKALRSTKERNAERDILIFILDHVVDHAHVYNQVLVRLQSIGQSSKRGKSHQHNRWKNTQVPTSEIRWGDVQCLDELMDTVPVDSQAHDFLHILRECCRGEAKSLIRSELRNKAESPPDMRRLLRSNSKKNLQSSPISNFHLTRTLSSIR